MRTSKILMNLGELVFHHVDTCLLDVKSCRNKISRCKKGGKGPKTCFLAEFTLYSSKIQINIRALCVMFNIDFLLEPSLT